MKFYVIDKDNEIKQVKQRDDIVLARTVTRPEGMVMTRRELINRLLDGIEGLEMKHTQARDFAAAVTKHVLRKVKIVKRKDLPKAIEPTIKIYVIVSKKLYDKHVGKKNKHVFWNKIVATDFNGHRQDNDGTKAIFEIRLGIIGSYDEATGTGTMSQLEDFVDYLKNHLKQAKVLVNSYTLGGIDKFRDYLNKTKEWNAEDAESISVVK